MSEEITSTSIIESLSDKSSYENDGKLSTACITLIAALLFLLGNSNRLSHLTSIFLVISVISLTISFLLLLWYTPRLSSRQKKWNKFVENRVGKLKDEIHQYGREEGKRDFQAKFAIKALESMKKGRKLSKEEINKIADEAMEELDKEDKRKDGSIVKNLFLKDFMTDLFFVREKVFLKPIEEDYSKIKFYLDMISWKTRYHFFVVGLVLLSVSVIAQIFSF